MLSHSVLKGAEPFYFTRPGNPAAVLLVHGFTSSCHSMRELGEKIFEAGFDSIGILLPGHGTTAEDMEKRSWIEWYKAVENKITELRSKYSQIFLCGQSMGGCLSLYAASYQPVSGVITISSGLRIFDWKLVFLPAVKYFVRFIRKYDGPDIKDPDAKAKEVHYDLMPVRSIAELQKFLKELRVQVGQVTCPVLLIHAKEDHTFDFKNLDLLYRGLHSANKKTVVLENSYHVATVDYDKTVIHREIIQFIKGLCK